jgi:hypothetical protein
MRNSRQLRHDGPSRLEAGRVEVVAPAYGCLEVYVKRDGVSRGASFLSEEDGGKFGVIFQILERFGGPGRFYGWGYVDEERTRVFHFVLQGEDQRPADFISISNRNGRVHVSGPARGSNAELKHGKLVAFYPEPASHGRERQKWTAKRVLPVDIDHFPVVVRLLASEGLLFFPEHNEVLDIFFEGLSNSLHQTLTNRAVLTSALNRVASDANIPAQYQMLARVERSKDLGSGTGPYPTTQVKPKSAPPLGRGAEAKGPGTSMPARDHIVTDVVRLDLHLGGD